MILQAIKMKSGEAAILKVGKIDIIRDFGLLPKDVEAMYLIPQKDIADDFLICNNHSMTHVMCLCMYLIIYIFDLVV